MRPRKVHVVCEYSYDGQGYEEFKEIRFMFYDKDTAESCAELLRKQQDLNESIQAQLKEYGLEITREYNSIFSVEEWEIADGDYEHETD